MASSKEIAQRNLLKQFYQLYDPYQAVELGEGSSGTSLASIRRQYNQLASRVDPEAPQTKLRDPLIVLPPELLLPCLEQVVYDRPDCEALLPLLLVSKGWNSWLRSASSLWNRIRIGRNDRKAALQLEFSRSSPLYIEILLQPQKDDDSWTETFRRCAHQIREIRLRCHSFYETDFPIRDQLFHHGLRSLKKLGTLSSLDTLEYVRQSMYPTPIANGFDLPEMPRVRNLNGFRIAASTLFAMPPPIPLHTLTRFSSESPLSDLAPAFTECPRLEHLELVEPIQGMIYDVETAEIPSLCSLTYDRSSLEAILPVLQNQGSNITNLQLKMKWLDLSNLSFLTLLPKLSQLGIVCFTASLTSETSIQLPQLPALSDFSFTQQPRGYDELEDTSRTSSLLLSLTSKVPYLRRLKLAFLEAFSIAHCLDFLQSLDVLEHLELSYEAAQVPTGTRRHKLVSITSLRLCNDQFLRYVDMPSLTNLWIDNATDNGSYIMYAGKFDSVTDLRWDIVIPHETSTQCASITSAFSNIRELRFAQAYARKDSNDFCELLLRHPASCPHLEKISFHCYPSWDLVIHMLLRRNLMPGSSVARIKTVQLPAYPTSSLMTPIECLLGGQIPLIPPLHDIALTFRNGLFDDKVYVP